MPNSLSTVLSNMRQKTVTLGWDVIVSYSASAVNDLFEQQYVANVRAHQDFPPINDKIEIASGVTVQLKNLTIGPPLIAFTPSVSDQQAVVTMSFIAGEISVVEKVGDVSFVSSYQRIVPGDQFALSMVVPLEKVQGHVTSDDKVVVDLKNASTYKANLLPGPSSASLLGQYFQTIFQSETKAVLVYGLGSILPGAEQNLTPDNFDIRTQVYPGAKNGDGAVTLLVATTYNPGGGNLPGAGFPYLIPDGSTCALVVASETLFTNIIASFYTSTLAGNPTVEVRQFSGTTPASYLAFTGGALNAGDAKGTWSSGGGVFHNFWSGTPGHWFSGQPGAQPVSVPLNGLSVQPSNDLLAINWSNGFSQNFTSVVTTPRIGASASQSSVTLNLSGSAALTPTVSGNDVNFPSVSPNLSVQFAASDWLAKFLGNGQVRDNISNQIATAAKNTAQEVMRLSLPQVTTFAVSHLLFPEQNVLQYAEVYLPGDLALFGAIQPTQTAFKVTPLQAVIASGETQQFSASGAGNTSWTVNPRFGTISSAGLYTAHSPSIIDKATPVVITARQGDNVATAVVTVVPAPVSVSPSFTLVSTDATTQLAVSTLGSLGPPTWTLSPDNGSAGQISAAGLFTPPSAFPPGVTIAIATATAGGHSASSLFCLVNAVLAVTLEPNISFLGPRGAMQFRANLPKLSWSLLTPSLGSITQDGLYTAPSIIGEPCTALVQAQLESDLIGIAVIVLSPSGS